MGDLDAAGEIVSGALIGRAVEPHAGEGHGEAHGGTCLNCGTALVGPHCHECGQSGHVHRSLAAIGHEILHGVAHFEGKLWKTLPLLAWRPGDLTRRYIAGERARFVSPMAIFLFSIFTMFAVFQILGISPPADLHAQRAKPQAAIEEARKDVLERRKNAIEARDERSADDPKRAKYVERIAEADKELQDLTTAAAALKSTSDPVEAVVTSHTGWHALDHGIEKWRENPALMIYKLQASSYKFSWLLIPLSLPFVWLLFFWKRQYKLYDHTVFITYSIAFMSLLFIAVTVLGAAGVSAAWLGTASFVIPLVHMTRQMKQAYSLGWPSAILRTIILCFFIIIILVLFLLLLVLMGMMG
ncbi:DUF3667 domain-containing protein [Sphingomonas sp. dw_22]|uniref:DUF3667 domain-containing protein n=1 Tax=Sphingomonas sp. dw_22 TaxID=2721175 RepID=UPI001BD52830|nr:DUF3667 domain-containing protein [Sphingomonas sp. dw_22]